ncbi:heterokaryon incompatibility protein-domain-containing protein [Paraphoma chrysanthemicola]|uniref:Heterokaryon incompatibility protein-domain-containing protein n=1 Tax=Paraphoma chrysanthemicola TaxID=798071 RepID=A0A8K0VWX4_9PLEO|nr:heterokaryon incompatibility protein-domain-containing protein [Paraphoma chrysanthemicola]
MIRLLRILSTDTQIYCDLQVFLLPNSPVFTALSYMWGDPSVTEPLMINRQILQVTINLANALRDVYHFWDEDSEDSTPGVEPAERWLWVDAICINQQNVLEKNDQVPLMQQIYTKAKHVIAWLGRSNERTRDGLEALNFIYKEIFMPDRFQIALTFLEEASFNPIATERIATLIGPEDLASFARLSWLVNYWQKEVIHTTPTSLFELITELFKLTYWHRIWTFQETVLAGNLLLMCGTTITSWRTHHSLSKCPSGIPPGEWYTLMEDFDITERAVSINAGRWSVNLRERNAALESNDRSTLVTSVSLIMSIHLSGKAVLYRATDPKDYVYGMGGVVDSRIRTDYGEAHSVAQVYQDHVSEWFIRRVGAPGQSFQDIEGGPDLWFLDLAGIGFPRQPFLGLPSWAPNFAGVAAARPIATCPKFFQRVYGIRENGLFADATPVPQLGKGILRCTAVIVTVVDDLGQLVTSEDFIWNRNIQSLHWLLWIFDSVLASLQHSCQNSTCIPLLEDVIHTLSFRKAAKSDASIHFRIRMLLSDMAYVCADSRGVSRNDFYRSLKLEPHCTLSKETDSAEERVFQQYSEAAQQFCVDERSTFLEEIAINVWLSAQKDANELRIASVDSAHFGLFPPLIHKGDILAVLGGFALPVVLRKRGNGYLFVGPCHVPLLMNPEATKERISLGHAWLEDIEIY